jgi:hypothetical protein
MTSTLRYWVICIPDMSDEERPELGNTDYSLGGVYLWAPFPTDPDGLVDSGLVDSDGNTIRVDPNTDIDGNQAARPFKLGEPVVLCPHCGRRFAATGWEFRGTPESNRDLHIWSRHSDDSRAQPNAEANA